MSFIITSKTRAVGNRAPRVIRGIDWTNPITKDLLWAPTAMGASVLDLADPNVTNITKGTSALSNAPHPESQALGYQNNFNNFPSLQNGVYSSKKVNTSGGLSWFARGQVTVLGASNRGFWLGQVQQSNSGYDWGAGYTTTSFAFGWYPFTGSSIFSPSSSFAVGDNIEWGGTFESGVTNGTKLFDRGVVVNSATLTGTRAASYSLNVGAGWATLKPWGSITQTALIWNRALSEYEMASLSDPQTKWDIFEQPRRTYFIPSGPVAGVNNFDVTGLAAGDYTAYFYQVDGSDVSDIVSSAEFTIASSGITSSPVAGALTLTGYAPAASVIDRATVTPTAGALVLTGYAPTAQSAVQLESSPVAGALVLTEHTPSASIVDRATVTPTAGALVLTEHTPSASIVDRATVTPTAGALALTGYAPSADLISADAVAPGAGTVDITGYAPSTTSVERATVVPVTGTATLTGYAPDASVIDRAVVAPTSAAVSIAGSAPTATVFSGAVVLPAAGAVTIAGKAPTATLFGDITTSPASDALTLTGYAPTASSVERATVSPGADTLVLTGYAPAASFGLSITTNAGTLAFTGYAASLTLVLRTTVTPTSAALAFTGGVPSVSVLGPSTASPSAGTITFVGNAPTVSNSGDTRLGTSLLMVLNAPDNVSENLDPKSLVMRA